MEIAGALATLTALGELTKSVVGGKIDSEVKAKASELADSIIGLQNTIFSIQSKNYQLLEENRDLKEQLNGLCGWEKVTDRYELVEVCSGVHLYRLKEMHNDEPAHYLCPNCFSSQKKSILVRGAKTINGITYMCASPECNARYHNYEDKKEVEPLPENAFKGFY